MSILTINNMSHGFEDRSIFNDVSFRLSKGEHVGLVGDNGQGKTTFMKLITGELLPDWGAIAWSQKISVGYMDQNVELNDYRTVKDVLQSAFKSLFLLENELNLLYKGMSSLTEADLKKCLKQASMIQDRLDARDFYSIDVKIDEIAYGFCIEDLLHKSPQELSGGQRTKILLAKLLLEKPDVLLLDEPTNYLDEENISWFKSYLTHYDHSFILISHDTHFINSVVNVIYHIENGSLTRYPGDYEKFTKLYALRKRQIIVEYSKQQKEIERLKAYIRKNKVRTATARQSKSREKKLDKIVEIQCNTRLADTHFNFTFSTDPGDVIFQTKNLVIGYDTPLTKPLNLEMKRGCKIALTGGNGIGKTTLLKSLMSIIKPVSGELELTDCLDIAYYEQEASANQEETVLTDVCNALSNLTIVEIRKLLAQCGLTSKHVNHELGLLSGGEQARVRLCKTVNKKSNVLFLDEPTNHLDSEAKRALKRALIQYEGSILLVSHEPEFYSDIVTDVWDCKRFKV